MLFDVVPGESCGGVKGKNLNRKLFGVEGATSCMHLVARRTEFKGEVSVLWNTGAEKKGGVS